MVFCIEVLSNSSGGSTYGMHDPLYGAYEKGCMDGKDMGATLTESGPGKSISEEVVDRMPSLCRGIWGTEPGEFGSENSVWEDVYYGF